MRTACSAPRASERGQEAYDFAIGTDIPVHPRHPRLNAFP